MMSSSMTIWLGAWIFQVYLNFCLQLLPSIETRTIGAWHKQFHGRA